MAKEPKFHDKSLDKWTDKQLVSYCNSVLTFFNRRAKEDAAEGDIFGGWDWPTMNIVHPELCQNYRNIIAEAHARLEKNQGKLAGLQYTKTTKGWEAAE